MTNISLAFLSKNQYSGFLNEPLYQKYDQYRKSEKNDTNGLNLLQFGENRLFISLFINPVAVTQQYGYGYVYVYVDGDDENT